MHASFIHWQGVGVHVVHLKAGVLPICLRDQGSCMY